MSAQMDQLIAQFENFQAKLRQAEARFAGVGDMQERIAQVETTVTSPDGNVTVVAGAGGTVTGLRLAPSAVRLGSDRLAEVIMATLRQAVGGAVRQQAGIVDDAFGDAWRSAQPHRASSRATGCSPRCSAPPWGPNR
ncbi:YbaB/EbfC family nucleoid-associated protein [Amycolatopsis rhizosphaerae]|uniref:YbaB/EbfC family nucleoid-associated protein n=1 Tax=Amycolatopsis rhizosphaerae TaxID=2053003 RepID=A0A557ZXX5_9PSEU|nr:YbaB/EbfC family nucleoid-associated protein [Amycolatopsis rhizosphaerae]TVT16850.1 YbaB/EbfC family nucleoid-associated protein [Amycolatopsis rhizosphaerae]